MRQITSGYTSDNNNYICTLIVLWWAQLCLHKRDRPQQAAYDVIRLLHCRTYVTGLCHDSLVGLAFNCDKYFM